MVDDYNMYKPGDRTSITILYFNIAMENGPIVYVSPIKHGDLP